MAKKTGRNNKTEHVLNLLTARKEPEHNDEKAALDIREQLERELQKDIREDGAEKKDLEPEEPGIRTAEQSKEQSETKEVGKKEPEEESPDYLFYNVMEDLVEGKVDFHADDRTVTLEPGQKVSYNPIQKTIAVEHVNVEEELNSNQRSFQYVRLSEIARSVGEYFHCAISFRDETLGSILFTGTLDFDMPLRHILEILTISTDTRFSQTGNGVAIYR